MFPLAKWAQNIQYWPDCPFVHRIAWTKTPWKISHKPLHRNNRQEIGFKNLSCRSDARAKDKAESLKNLAKLLGRKNFVLPIRRCKGMFFSYSKGIGKNSITFNIAIESYSIFCGVKNRSIICPKKKKKCSMKRPFVTYARKSLQIHHSCQRPLSCIRAI